MPASLEPLPTARLLRAGGEGLLVSLATLSAWPFAGADPYPEYLLTAGGLLLALCWAAHAAVTRTYRFRLDLASGALAGLILLTAFQLVPLPLAVVRVVSPARADWHEALLPAQLERLPGEPDPPPRADWLPLTADPHATRTLLGQLVALFAVYAAARHWLADRHSLRRFAWAAMLNGVLLALVALGQFFSSKAGVVFWTYDTGGAVFGPFVCRNHYPDFLAFGIGGAVCLMHPPPGEKQRKPAGGTFRERLVRLLDIFDRPASLTAAFALVLMLASIPFSQSRGGVAAVAVAAVAAAVLVGWGRWRGGLPVLGVSVSAAVGMALWLGVGPIQERFRDDGKTLDDRTPLWTAAARQLPGLWGGGSGGGTFVWVEPLGRTTESPGTVYEHAHNEYLEAAVEGGVVRLALTLVLAVGVPVLLACGYRRLRGRSAGGFVIGAWFAVTALAVHSVVDFGVHLPAVALAAAATAGMAMGAVGEGETGRGGDRGTGDTEAAVVSPVPLSPGLFKFFPLLLVFAVGFATLDARTRWRANRCRLAAVATPDLVDRIRLQADRTAVDPTDPAGWLDMAQAHLDAAVAERTATGFTPDTVQQHIHPALAALRTARGLCPLYPEVQLRLGLYARYFEQSEPPAAHLHRARRLLPSDPDVWYACGVEELTSGDRTAAEASWRRSLELGPGRLKLILKASAELPAEALRDRVLADDPAVLMAAADERPAAERRVFVEPAAKAAERDGLTVPQLIATATACDEVDRLETAAAMWDRATTADPNNRELRDAAARWFERQERYADAVPHLEWLAGRTSGDISLRDRLAAARHGADLKRVIGR